ncbi:MAG: flagellar biosynthetic protein FliO [Spirochaetaceae bacterium]|nr:flagellar biosynthetic protein FliO [Spirochaetaceae bacterium]
MLFLSGVIQNQVFSQSFGETPNVAADTAVVNDAREEERSYLLGEDVGVPQEQNDDVMSVWTIFRVIVVLALTASAVYGIVYLLKRKKTGDIPDDNYLKVLARSPINMKTAAAVVAVGNKAWLVGLSDTNVSTIAEISDKETVDAMLLAYSERVASSKGTAPLNFTSILRRFSGAGGGTFSKRPDAESLPAANLQRSRERLKNL